MQRIPDEKDNEKDEAGNDCTAANDADNEPRQLCTSNE